MGAVIGAVYAAGLDGLDAKLIRGHLSRVLRNRSDGIGKLLAPR